MCLAGAMAVSRYHTQEVAGSYPFTVMTNILVTDFSEFNENISGNSIAQALARFLVFDMTKNTTKTAQAIFITQIVKMLT